MRNIEQTHRYVVLLVVFFSSLIVVFATHYTCTHTHTNNSFDFMCITLVSKWINRTIEYMVSMVHMFIRITCEKCVTSQFRKIVSLERFFVSLVHQFASDICYENWMWCKPLRLLFVHKIEICYYCHCCCCCCDCYYCHVYALQHE